MCRTRAAFYSDVRSTRAACGPIQPDGEPVANSNKPNDNVKALPTAGRLVLDEAAIDAAQLRLLSWLNLHR